MRHGPLLPLAPRPYDDELLSSWQDRVASRYGRTIAEIEQWLDASSVDMPVGRMGRNSCPDAAEIAVWARACRLPAASIARLALDQDHRPLHWVVLNSTNQSLCADCLDEDLVEGRDHHRRRRWAHAESVVCPRHHRPLVDRCPTCHGERGFRQHWSAGLSRLRCLACSDVIAGRGPTTAKSEWVAFLLSVTAAMTSSVEQSNAAATTDIDLAAKVLWSVPNSGGKPLICWLGHTKKPRGEGMPTNWEMPMATASLNWRVATLVGIAQLLDLSDARNQIGQPPAFILDAFASQRQIKMPRRAPHAPETRRWKPVEPTNTRSDADYAAMARSILASPEWAAVRVWEPCRRDKALGQLMMRALDQARQAPDGAPGPAAP